MKYLSLDGLKTVITKVLALLSSKQDVIDDLTTIRSNASTGAGLKTKVDGIEAKAQVNTIESIKVNNSALTITDKTVNIDITSASVAKATNADNSTKATQDADGNIITTTYATKTELKDYAKLTEIASVFKYKGSVTSYANLPTSDQVTGDVYNVESANTEKDIKAGDNVVWNGTEWDVLAGTVDLSSYALKSELPEAETLTTESQVTALFSSSSSTSEDTSAITDAHINALIDAKLGVIEDGTY